MKARYNVSPLLFHSNFLTFWYSWFHGLPKLEYFPLVLKHIQDPSTDQTFNLPGGKEKTVPWDAFQS